MTRTPKKPRKLPTRSEYKFGKIAMIIIGSLSLFLAVILAFTKKSWGMCAFFLLMAAGSLALAKVYHKVLKNMK